MTGWFITAGIILFFCLIFFVPFHINLSYVEKEFFWQIRWFGIKLPIPPKKKEKPDQPKKQKKSKQNKKEKNSPEEKTEQSKKKDKKSKSKRSFSEIFELICRILNSIPRPLRILWKGISIHRLYVVAEVGDFDAAKCALNYATITSSVHTGIGILCSALRVKLKRVAIHPKFTAEETTWNVSCSIHFCIGSALGAAISFGLSFLYHTIQDQKEAKKASKQ